MFYHFPADNRGSPGGCPASILEEAGGTERILFVDDEPFQTDLGRQMLGRLGYHVSAFTSSLEALVRLQAEPEAYDLVITDYKMPEFNGLELLVAIKKYRPQTEVIIVTGYGSMESAIQAMKFGSYDYLQKPFDVVQVTALEEFCWNGTSVSAPQNVRRFCHLTWKLDDGQWRLVTRTPDGLEETDLDVGAPPSGISSDPLCP